MLESYENYVVLKGTEYVVGVPYSDTGFIRMSISAYDGYPFPDFVSALRIAKVIGGLVMILNRLTGEVRGGWQ